MAERQAIQIKSKRFAIRVIRMYQFLCQEKREFVLSKQVLRSGTSIGANVAEAEAAISRKDFLSKMYIAFKESAETLYWLDLLVETGYLSQEMYLSMKRDCDELNKLLASITKTVGNR